MKKACVFFLVGLFLTVGVASPSPTERKTGISGYGPLLGLSLAKFCEKDFDNGFKAGLALGGFLNFRLTPRISLAGQLLFVQKGYAYTETDAYGLYKSRLTLNYLELPLLVRYTLEEDTLGAYAFAGPALGLKMGGTFRYEYDSLRGEDTDLSHFRGTDLGLKFGGGVDYPLCSGRLGFELGLTLGLCNVYARSDADYRAGNFAVLLALFYVLGGR